MPPTNANKSETAQDRFLRRAEVCKLTGLSVSTLYDMMSKGTFCKSVQISKRLVCWSEREVMAWMAGRIQDRNDAAAKKGGKL